MPRYLVLTPLGYDRPAPYMPGDIVDIDEKEAPGLIEAGVIGDTPLPEEKTPNVADAVKLVQAAATLEELDVLAKGETRKSVLTAIETRCKALEG